MGEEQQPLEVETAVCDSFMVLCSQSGALGNTVGCIFGAWGSHSGQSWNIVLGARLVASAVPLWTQEFSLRVFLPGEPGSEAKCLEFSRMAESNKMAEAL